MRSRPARTVLAGAIMSAMLAASLFTSSRTALGSAAGKQHTRAHSHALTKVHFILNWVPNVEFAGLWAAQRFNWFKKAGIDMSFTPWSESVKPETDVASQGGNTFGFQSGAAIAIARAQGVPIVATYTDTQRSVFGLTVLNKSHITNIKQLKGKRIGYQPHELYVPQTMLANAGLKPSDYKLVPVGFDIAQLTGGQVDAYLTFLTNEPISLTLNGVPNHSFRAADYGFHFYDDVMFTTQNLMVHNPALVRKVTTVVAQGFKWAHTHPDLAARLTVNNYYPAPKGVSATNNAKQQTLEMRMFKQFSADSKGRYTGLMNTRYWQDSIDTLYRYGEIKSKTSAAGIFTNSFNPYRNGSYR